MILKKNLVTGALCHPVRTGLTDFHTFLQLSPFLLSLSVIGYIDSSLEEEHMPVFSTLDANTRHREPKDWTYYMLYLLYVCVCIYSMCLCSYICI